jgi:hypothetical protein
LDGVEGGIGSLKWHEVLIFDRTCFVVGHVRWKRISSRPSWSGASQGGRGGDAAAASRELDRVREERDILKSAGDFLGTFAMKYAFIQEHVSQHSVVRLCEALGVSHGGFYNWFSRPDSQRCRHSSLLAGVQSSPHAPATSKPPSMPH